MNAIERLNFYRSPGGETELLLTVLGRTARASISRKVALLALAELAAALHLGDDELRGVVEAAQVLKWHGVSHGGSDPEPTAAAAEIMRGGA